MCTDFNANKDWVGGQRDQRIPPPPPPPPPPPNPMGPAPPETQPNFDASGWAGVDLPHDMHINQSASLANCPTGCSGRSYLRRHTGWYRKQFNVPADWTGSHISIEFEGAFHYSMIYLNGVLVTNHTCGYTSFDVALPAAHLLPGQPNTIAVFVDGTSGTGWWYEGGGLFRHVWLVKRSQSHLVTWGVFVAPLVQPSTVQHSVGGGAGGEVLTGTVTLNISAVAVAAAGSTVSAVADIFDPSGAHVATLPTPPALVPAGGMVTLKVTGKLADKATLWTIRAPALYTVRVRLLSPTATVLDEENITSGFRSLHYDSTNGFQMNKQEVKVRGFCDHNDFASVGVGVPDRLNLYRAQAARSVGGNGRRTSHNPPNPSMLDIYDRVGIVVMAENRDFFAGPQYFDNMADLVRRDRNHPSVTIWSFCNEGACSAGGDPTAAGTGFRAMSYEFDGTRPVLGNMVGDQPEGPLSNLTDVQGFSHAGFGTLQSYHETYPSKPIFESECCSCNTQRGEPRRTDLVEPSFNADCLASQTNASQGVPWVVGGMIWTLFDYYGEPSFGGWPHVSSTFGSFDLAGFAKPAVSWYRSFWLLQVPDSSPDKPFSTAGTHVVKIVEDWEPATQPTYPPNTTDVSPCATAGKRRITFNGNGINGTGTLRDPNGYCIDGTCSDPSSGECSKLPLAPCNPNAPAQQFAYTPELYFKSVTSGGCLNVWNGGGSDNVGLWTCGMSDNNRWNATPQGYMTLASSAEGARCLTNGLSTAAGMDVHVYTDLESVELFVNGVSAGNRSIINPGLTPTATAQSWAAFTDIPFVAGNLTAVARGASGAEVTTSVHTSGQATSMQLSLDAPSPVTGTGASLLLDGQDAGLVRVTLLDANGRLASQATNNVSFEIVSGPGRIVGAHNGDPQCHEPNQVPWHSAYHGLVRAVVMVTEDSSSPSWHRSRLLEIDVNANAQTRIVRDEEMVAAVPIVVRASSSGLPDATIQITTSTDPAAGVLAVAAASAGKAVVIN